MKLFNKTILFVSVLAIGLLGCGEDDEGGSISAINCVNFQTDLSIVAASKEILTASTAYASDQSTANCNAYVSALDNYFVALEPYVEQCGDDDSFAQLQSSIDQFESIKNSLNCGG